jgi:hypothetical protein
MTKYIPKNLNQHFHLIEFDTGVFMLLDSSMNTLMPMYVGKNRHEVESLLRQVKKFSGPNSPDDMLKVYSIVNGIITLKLQSTFYVIFNKTKKGTD